MVVGMETLGSPPAQEADLQGSLQCPGVRVSRRAAAYGLEWVKRMGGGAFPSTSGPLAPPPPLLKRDRVPTGARPWMSRHDKKPLSLRVS